MKKQIRTGVAAVAAATALGGVAIATGTDAVGAHDQWARASLRGADGTRLGTVSFTDDEYSDYTEVTVRLRRVGAPSAFHGLHIHANDTSTNGGGCVADPAQPPATWFVSADGHWKHGSTELHGSHAGDLPSPFVNADGSARIRFNVDKLTPAEVLGRAVVLHAGPDNFGNVPVGGAADQYVAGATALAKTQTTGNAGDRFGCGVIKQG